jgi:hypothetical protein
VTDWSSASGPLRYILHRRTALIAKGGIAEIDSSRSTAEGDARDPCLRDSKRLSVSHIDGLTILKTWVSALR